MTTLLILLSVALLIFWDYRRLKKRPRKQKSEEKANKELERNVQVNSNSDEYTLCSSSSISNALSILDQLKKYNDATKGQGFYKSIRGLNVTKVELIRSFYFLRDCHFFCEKAENIYQNKQFLNSLEFLEMQVISFYLDVPILDIPTDKKENYSFGLKHKTTANLGEKQLEELKLIYWRKPNHWLFYAKNFGEETLLGTYCRERSEFPSYIGFGRLNPKTSLETTDIVSVDYFFQDNPAHRISYNKNNGSWQFKDIFDDTGGISSSSNLKDAVIMHFNNLDCKSNSIFNFVRDTVCSRGNIYFQNLASMKDEGGVASYFPAGRLVILRLPIFFDEEGRVKLNILENQIPYIEAEKRSLLKLCEAYNTSILVSKSNGVTSVIPVLMIEYIVTLVSILDVIDWFCDNNLLSNDKVYRMLIQDSKAKNQHGLQTFEGDANIDSIVYTILTKGIDNSKIKFEEFEKKFVESFMNTN